MLRKVKYVKVKPDGNGMVSLTGVGDTCAWTGGNGKGNTCGDEFFVFALYFTLPLVTLWHKISKSHFNIAKCVIFYFFSWLFASLQSRQTPNRLPSVSFAVHGYNLSMDSFRE